MGSGTGIVPRDIPFNRPALIGREVSYLRVAIRRGQLSGDGHFTARCNALIAERNPNWQDMTAHIPV